MYAWRHFKPAVDDYTTIGNYQRLARAWETRALAAEAAVRDLRKENTTLREALNNQSESANS